ncbi:hypothetical protein [Nocardioides sp.]|uniref:hypothetical protein n=1 Tax=Nocardioides sp. TaxID=35761 RepID=UPI002CD48F0C|nr:hypothetical protein [Nocardioides sp.]HSX68450.1 hypothetical protein [Nocardioides sp.]
MTTISTDDDLDLIFTGFRDGIAEDASDGWTMFRLADGDEFAHWQTEKNRVEVLDVLIQHNTGQVTVELIYNGDFDAIANLPLGNFVQIAPPRLSAFLIDKVPTLRRLDSGEEV